LAARRLNSRAFALLARRNGTQRPRRDGRDRLFLLIGRQVFDELLIRFFKLGVLVELLKNAGANAFAPIDLVDVLQDKHALQPLSRQTLDVGPFLRVRLDVGIDLGVDFCVVAVLGRVARGFSGGSAVTVGILLSPFEAHIYILVCSGVRLTESGDDLAAEEINELEGVLVLNRQAHEKLGAGRSAKPLLDFLACFRVPRDSGGRHGDDDRLVFHKGQWCVTICLRATAEAMESVWAGLTVCRLRPGAPASRLRPS
jgi:hypothetical protein